MEINSGVHLYLKVILQNAIRWSWFWSWSCHFGLGLGLKNLVLFTSLMLRRLCTHYVHTTLLQVPYAYKQDQSEKASPTEVKFSAVWGLSEDDDVTNWGKLKKGGRTIEGKDRSINSMRVTRLVLCNFTFNLEVCVKLHSRICSNSYNPVFRVAVWMTKLASTAGRWDLSITDKAFIL